MCVPMWEQLFLPWLGSNPSVLLLRICRIVASAMKSTSWPGTRPSPSCACPSATAMERSSELLRPSTSPPAVSSSPKTTKRCVVYSPSVVPGWTFGILFPWERGSARVYLQFGFIFLHLSCGLVGRSQTFVSVSGLLPAKFSDSSHLSPETSCSEFRRAWRILFWICNNISALLMRTVWMFNHPFCGFQPNTQTPRFKIRDLYITHASLWIHPF